ncbi:cytochrome P450, partial [Obelidium mucronatum]
MIDSNQLLPIASATIAVLAVAAWGLKSTRQKDSPPLAAHGIPVLGHIHVLMEGPQVYLQKLFDGIQTNVVEARSIGFSIYVVRGPEFAKKVLTSSHLNTRYADPEALKALNSHECGLLLNANVESWKRSRKILVESVGRPKFIASLAPKINEYMSPLFSDLDKLDESKTPVLVNRMFGSISLDVIMDIIFSENQHAAEGYLGSLLTGVPQPNNVVLEHVHKMMEAIMFYLITPMVLCKWVPGFSGTAYQHKQEIERWDDCVMGLIKQKKEQMECSGEMSAVSEHADLASILIRACQASENSATWIQETLGLVKETIGGGTDTSSNTMCFLTYELARNPAIADKIHDEIVEFVGSDGELTFENVGKLKLLEAAIHETSRLHAVVQMTQRAIHEDFVVGEYTLKKGSMVFVAIQPNQHAESSWKDPLVFDPSRFLVHKDLGGPLGFGFAHLPFGHGNRKCPGEALALMEMKLVMGNLIRRYKFVLADPSKGLKIKDSLTLECQDLPVFFSRRE